MSTGNNRNKKTANVKETIGSLLTTLRQFTPAEQNDILNDVVTEIAIDRANNFFSLKKAGEQAGLEMDKFSSIANSRFDGVIKESAQRIMDSDGVLRKG